MKYFLGVDGGQSSTLALIGDEAGRVIGAGRAGPCNHATVAEGRKRFTRALSESVNEAAAQAGIASPEFEAACMGFSGGPEDKERLAREMVSAHRYSIVHDALIALAGATGGEPGVVVIAGTGSIAFGRNQAGKTARAGGWGYAFGDEGSAFDIVRKALRASLRFEEGWGPSTELRDALLTRAGALYANDLLHRFYSADYPRVRVAEFASLVDQAAGAGDAVARDVLHEAAQSLATIASAVREQLFAPGHIVTVAYSGGVFHSALLRERFRMLVELHDGNRVAAPQQGPAAGALIEAYRLAGTRVSLSGAPQE
ncbi:MAG TPA: BadF/BadG/BcrA/BcrD ATPase family protein [Bryobacteraceae bacterium]|nr:BadF/BadG/BcrA/BcrD ATPase family protein [Bryobacteraceae bacterium]